MVDPLHPERHFTQRIGWLRAAVLGANDGIVSTSSLLIGVAAAGAAHREIMLAGIAGLFAGALSMAAGEYVSVSSQSDTERADLERERRELESEPELEREELVRIYVGRGLDETLAREVARQLTAHDALAAHARDELGILEQMRARPFQAAWASAASFAAGAAMPLGVASVSSGPSVLPLVAGTSLASLGLLGSVAARSGGAGVAVGASRVTLWGALAMALTAAAGALFGAAP